MDPDTVLWWMRRSDKARTQFNGDNTSLVVTLTDFRYWIGKGDGDPIVWGNGLDFDNTILANAYRILKIPVPWEFWNNRC